MSAAEQTHDQAPREPTRVARFCHKCAQLGHTSRQCLTYKTRPCKYFYRGRCSKPPQVCMYAHGDLELRPSSMNWCTRIIYENGRRTIEGCCNPGHTIHQCQLQRSGMWTPAPVDTEVAPPRVQDEATDDVLEDGEE